MASFFQDIWNSVFEPGTNPSLLIATNVTFGALQLVLAGLLYATHSIHFAVLSALCGGLWWAINWFAAELKVYQAREEEEKRQKEAKEKKEDGKRGRRTSRGVSVEDSETEVEKDVAEGKSEAVQLGEQMQEAYRRGLAPQPSPGGSKSSVSTEDEWERVSENEKDK